MRETTSNEFLEWQEFLDKEEWSKHHRADYYLAQIACEVARGRQQRPGQLKTEQFLMKFVTRGPDQKPVSQDELDQMTAVSKAKWFAGTGVGTTKPPTAPPAVATKTGTVGNGNVGAGTRAVGGAPRRRG